MQGAVSAQQGPAGGGEPLPTPVGTEGCSGATVSILALQKVLSQNFPFFACLLSAKPCLLAAVCFNPNLVPVLRFF